MFKIDKYIWKLMEGYAPSVRNRSATDWLRLHLALGLIIWIFSIDLPPNSFSFQQLKPFSILPTESSSLSGFSALFQSLE